MWIIFHLIFLSVPHNSNNNDCHHWLRAYCFPGAAQVYYLLYTFMNLILFLQGFPAGASGKEPTCQCRRHRDENLIQGRSPVARHGTHSSILAWRNAWTEESGGLLFIAKSQTQLKGLNKHKLPILITNYK